jgi:outer membrane immunogenic protein
MKAFRTSIVCLVAGAALGVTTLPVNAQNYYNRWGGLYIGGSVGGAWTDMSFTRDFPAFVGAPRSIGTDPSSWIGGGHIGLQHQFGPWVLGVEGTLSGGDFDSASLRDPAFPTIRHKTDVNYLMTATAKLGYAFDSHWLGYVKAGYAGADVEIQTLQTVNGNGLTSSKHEHGWTVGVGLDYMLFDGVMVGVNYDYVRLDLSNRTAQFTMPPQDVMTISGGDLDIHAVTARVTFKLGREEYVESLK